MIGGTVTLSRRGRPARVYRRGTNLVTSVRGIAVRFRPDKRGYVRLLDKSIPGLTEEDLEYARSVVLRD